MRSNWFKLLLIVLVVGVAALADLPPAQKTFFEKVPLVGESLATQKIQLGLDLQGGTHLDYRVLTDDIPESDISAVVAGVKEVIERRVNSLGVAEPNIFTSRVGDEEHIIVELAGIRDIEEAKAVVGKTIQLEFKEQQTEIDPNEAVEIEKKANEFLAAALADPENFESIFDEDFKSGAQISLSKNEPVEVDGEVVDAGWKWLDEIGEQFAPVAELNPGEVFPNLLEPSGEYFIDSDGSVKQATGFYIAQLLAKEDSVERIVETDEERRASHILISFAGAQSAAETITRSREEAETLANSILERAQNLPNSEIESEPDSENTEPQNFAELAQKYSDDPTATENSGDLDFFTPERMVPTFAEPVFAAAEFGILPEIAESDFGFHIIEFTDKKDASSTTTSETRVRLAKAFFSTVPSGWQSTGLTGQHFRRADVGSDPTTMRPLVNIYFTQVAIANDSFEWWLLVWYLVALTAGIALFTALVGLLFSEGRSANSRRDKMLAFFAALVLAGAIVAIQKTDKVDEVPAESVDDSAEIAETDSAGVDLFAEITKRNLQKPIAIFLDELPIIDTNGDGKIDAADPAYSPTVQSEILNGQAVISGLSSYEEANQLAQNLNTGAIPAPVKLSSQFTIGATLGESALATSLEAGALGLVFIAIFMLLIYRLPGLVATVALAIYGIIIVFAFQIFGVVLTLAGVAGVILSIGMAVDANILIFERMKEELKLGKSLSRSVEDGFDRAWTSIRDSNVSSLITCAILFWFGSSIIQGFALTLAVGILISMLTAITISRTFLRMIVGMIKKPFFYNIKK